MSNNQTIFEIYKKVRRGETLSVENQFLYLIHIEGLTSEKAHTKINLDKVRKQRENVN